MAKVTVRYWVGTTQRTGTARTYNGAMRLANRTQNAFGPEFLDEQGRELADDGVGLCVAATAHGKVREYVVMA